MSQLLRRWTRDEEGQLLAYVREGLASDEISEKLKRTIGAVIIRKKKLAQQSMKDEPDIKFEVLSKKYGLALDDIKEQSKLLKEAPPDRGQLLNELVGLRTEVRELKELLKLDRTPS